MLLFSRVVRPSLTAELSTVADLGSRARMHSEEGSPAEIFVALPHPGTVSAFDRAPSAVSAKEEWLEDFPRLARAASVVSVVAGSPEAGSTVLEDVDNQRSDDVKEGGGMSTSVRQFLNRRLLVILFSVILVATAVVSVIPAFGQQQGSTETSAALEVPKGKAFRTPADATDALYAAARRDDETELLAIFGPGSKDLVIWNDNREERKQQREQFADKYDQMHRLVKEPDGTVALYVGAENWPLPIPIVEYKGEWYFDTELGKQEILYRRVGRNEMESLQVCHALVDAEEEYHNDARQYTANFISTGNSHNGLYWNPSENGQKSLIGPYLAHAGVGRSNTESNEPYHGYYYRILINPGSSNAANAEAFSVVAFPADYRSSGVKTFIMDENGTAYEKDLGPNTGELARQISSYPPDNSWQKIE